MSIRRRRGFSLIELLIAMVVMGVVLAGTMNFFIGQSRTFRKATTDMVLLQNARFATDLLSEHLRSVGANLTVGQPAIIYEDSKTFAFNADYATKTVGDLDAIYYEPNAPSGQVQALNTASQFVIPNSSLSYPQANYEISAGMPSPAEAIVFWFAPDTETTRTDDYVLLRQVNAAAPEVVVRNVLADSTQPFFRYMYLKVDAAGNSSIDTLATPLLPLSYDKDTLVSADKNRMRGVMVSFIVTNGLADTAERTRPVSVVVQLPNLGQRALQTCGNPPIDLTAPVATVTGPNTVTVTWSADADETGGERDVMRYAIWRKSEFDPNWHEPVASIPAGGGGTYTYVDTSVLPTHTYWYAVAAQDCTPAFSAPVSSNGISP
jgi:prepilin-type N-terminal cleavage/methylation domain-containing protein